MVIMSTLMSVTVFMNFSKSRSDMSRAVGVSAEAEAGDGAVAGASSTYSGLCCSFTDMDICSPFAVLVSCSFDRFCQLFFWQVLSVVLLAVASVV